LPAGTRLRASAFRAVREPGRARGLRFGPLLPTLSGPANAAQDITCIRRQKGMKSAQADERFDALVAQVHDWVESAVALDAGHFPSELLSDLQDLIEELKAFLEDEGGSYERKDVTELFVTPEMAEVIQRFPRVRRLMESSWGAQLTELIEEEGGGFEGFEDDDDDD
jgi:hypothetical protein